MFSSYKMRLLTKQNSHNLGQCDRFFQVKSTCSIFWYDLNISWHSTMQVPLYYISLESWNFPLSNVIINVSTFPHIQSLYPLQAHIFLFNLSYLFPIQILTSKMPLAIESILYLDRLSTKFQTLKLMIYEISNELFAIFFSQNTVFLL